MKVLKWLNFGNIIGMLPLTKNFVYVVLEGFVRVGVLGADPVTGGVRIITFLWMDLEVSPG